MDKVVYGDSLPWPVGADGFGLSLQRRNFSDYGNDPANWLAGLPKPGAPTVASGLPPAISMSPVGQSLIAGDTTSLRVSATGTGPLHYLWRFNGANLAGATHSSLALQNVSMGQAGDYEAIVFNDAGAALSAKVTLNVLLPVSILTQPATASVRVGASTNFSIVAYSPIPVRLKVSMLDMATETSSNPAPSEGGSSLFSVE